ncbi:MAG: DUF3261 domain-containing protein [Treponema sp.]|nr:DUF3261 domain-containing protein [Treponema sp.]
MKQFFLFSVCIICLFSCTSAAGKNALHVYLTDSSRFVLMHPEAIEKTMDMAQFLSAEFRGQNYFFNAWVKADENAIEIALFNEFGASFGELSYTAGNIHFSSAVLPRIALQYIKPEYIIADFQLCFYAPFLLEKQLNDSGLVLEITDSGSLHGSRHGSRDSTRRILSGNDVIIEIEKTGNSVKLVNHLRNYTYTLEGVFHE